MLRGYRNSTRLVSDLRWPLWLIHAGRVTRVKGNTHPSSLLNGEEASECQATKAEPEPPSAHLSPQPSATCGMCCMWPKRFSVGNFRLLSVILKTLSVALHSSSSAPL